MKLSRFTLRDLFLLMLVVACPSAARAEDDFQKMWREKLAKCEAIRVIPSRTEARTRILKDKEQVAEFLKVLAEAHKKSRLAEDEAVVGAAPFAGVLELTLSDKSMVTVSVHAGGLVVIAKPHRYSADFKRRETMLRLFELMGAKLDFADSED